MAPAALLFVTAMLAGGAAADDHAVDFIIGATTSQPRPFLRDGAPLWAILADENGYRLSRQVAQVRTFEYRNPARSDGALTGQRLVGPEAALALVHLVGAIDLREGTVSLVARDHTLIDYSFGREVTPASPLTLRLADRVFRVAAEARPAERGHKSLRVVLEEGPRRQELVASDDAVDPFARLAWLGDIDRDGSPDLLLSVRTHYAVTSHRLFVSSLAEAGQLSKLVGVLDEDTD